MVGRGVAPVRHYQMTHRTTHTHPAPVASSYGHALLLPRRTAEQVVHRAQLDVSPSPREQRRHEDLSGNRVAYFHVTEPHTVLEVTARSVLSVDRPHVDAVTLPQLAWDQVAALVRAVRTTGRPGDGTHPSPREVLHIASGSLPSDTVPLSERAQALALDTFAPGQSLAAAVTLLTTRINRTFEHRSGAGAHPLEDALEQGRGTSQDLAHIMIAALRSLGIAALYVTGHLAAGTGSAGRGEPSHAWVAVWFPGAGWVHVDPTLGGFIDDRHVILGWGRDHRDVTPLRGIAYSDGSGPAVAVDVDLHPLGADELARVLHGDAT